MSGASDRRSGIRHPHDDADESAAELFPVPLGLDAAAVSGGFG